MKTKKIYTYNKSKNHTSKQTDKYILESVEKYLEEKGLPTENISVIHDSRGKPEIQYDNDEVEIFASATHTDNIVLVAVSTNEIGIDCEEKTRRIRHIGRLAGSFFSPAEIMSLEGLCDEDKRLQFLNIWVKKESYVKLTGIGLSGIRDIDTLSLPDHIVFTEKVLGDDYIVSICEWKTPPSKKAE